MFSIAKFLVFFSSVEEERLKRLRNKYYRSENCPNVVIPYVNRKIWNRKPLSSQRMIDTNLRKIELFEGYICYNHQVAYKKRKEILSPLIDAIAVLGQATNYNNQVR